LAERDPGFLDQAIDEGSGADTAVILYTSGTTGTPKGVVLSHENLLVTSRNAAEFDHITPDTNSLAYLPMAWVGDNIFSFSEAFVAGFCVNCPESGATVMQDMREIGPDFYFGPPRIFENLLTMVMIRMEDAGWIKRKLFHYFMGVARRAGGRILDHQSVSLWDRLLYGVGELLIFGPLKNTLGMSRIRVAYTAGEAIGPELFDFYRSLGINLKQLYGQTEAAVFVTMQRDGEVRSETVGTAFTDVELKIAENSEVLYRSPGVFQEYYKNPEATAETKTPDGWVKTGDAGYVDEEGHLRIIDRAKDVGKMNDGSMFAPKYIENKLKFYQYIKEAVTFGDQKDYASAFINIDLDAVSNWAERNNITYGGYQEIASHDKVRGLIEDCIAKVNEDLAADSHLRSSQIQRFIILHKELDADDGELTRTRKVRRRIIAEKYGTLIDALYSGQQHVEVESQVTFEDGSTGSLHADLKIYDLPGLKPMHESLAAAS
jgi:long-chain acyl-CoA synthetase